MSNTIAFELDGKPVEALPGETIWQAAKRLGTEIPHLCYAPEPGYRADGNCRVCMVEVDGERALVPSCTRKPTAGIRVQSASARAKMTQRVVMELLIADQPPRATSPDPTSKFWAWADRMEISTSRFPQVDRWPHDSSHPAMRANLDACIQFTLCVRACREVQVNDVIGMAHRQLAAVSEVTGLARSTIGRGQADLDTAPLPKGRVRLMACTTLAPMPGG